MSQPANIGLQPELIEETSARLCPEVRLLIRILAHEIVGKWRIEQSKLAINDDVPLPAPSRLGCNQAKLPS